MPWLAVTEVDHGLAPDCSAHLETVASFAAASCWYSIVLAQVALRLGELMTAETFKT
ncbi:hypothetical protein [Bradyrhizobium jicamae]|uniref:hypothetical protein n=1 Tax=Bradyrhizobium jicamae TaxID=280332 RepID=UPI000B19610B|nr:hypothetical protein [Bradyrhizobium jicamae]